METPTRRDPPPPQATERTRPVVRLGNRYRLKDVARSGSVGEIWDAFDEWNDQLVAVEILAQGQAARSFRGSRSAELLRAAVRPWFQHPTAVGLQRVESDDHAAFLVMERVGGQTLQERLDHGGLISSLEAARIGSDVASALAAAHAAGLAHGAVTTSQIILSPDGRAMLGDIGVAWAMQTGSTSHPGTAKAGTRAKTRSGVTNSLTEAAQRTDLWGLGAILMAILQGQPPRDELVRSMRSIVYTVSDHALAHLTSAAEIADELRELVRHHEATGGAGRRPGQSEMSGATMSFGRVAAGLIALGVIAAVTVVAGQVTTSGPQSIGIRSPIARSSTGAPGSPRPPAPTGPAFRVPVVTGMSVAQARDALARMGLAVLDVVPTLGSPGRVVRTDPTSGRRIGSTTSVILYVGTTPDRLQGESPGGP
jgi:serine/threonine protein kinase